MCDNVASNAALHSKNEEEEEEEHVHVNSSHKSYFIDLLAWWLPVNDSVVDVLSIRQVATLLYNVTINVVTCVMRLVFVA